MNDFVEKGIRLGFEHHFLIWSVLSLTIAGYTYVVPCESTQQASIKLNQVLVLTLQIPIAFQPGNKHLFHRMI